MGVDQGNVSTYYQKLSIQAIQQQQKHIKIWGKIKIPYTFQIYENSEFDVFANFLF